MNRRTTWILIGALAILGTFAYYLNTNPDAFSTATPTPTSSAEPTTLWSLDTANVLSFSVVDNVNQLTFSAAVDANGIWTITQPEPGEADQTQLSSLASSLSALYVNRTITETVNLADFGLLPPAYVLEVIQRDGSALKAGIGNKDPFDTAYYVLRDGEANAVLVGSFSLDTFLGLPAQPPFAVPTPAATLEGLFPLPGAGTPTSP